MNLLDQKDDFDYFNYSVPKDDPIHDAANDSQLRQAIKTQMSYASVVVVLAGVYSSYSKWIDIEISIAESGFANPKSILAVEPYGSERTSVKVKNAADEIVRWNTDSIVNAIGRLA